LLLRHPLAWLCLLPLLLVGRRIVAGESFVAAAPAAFEPWSLEDPERAARARERLDAHAIDGLAPVWSERRAAREALEAGCWPSWDHRAGLGAPLAGQSVAGMWYPPNLATLWLPPERALGWLAILSLWLAGVALHALLRAREIEPRAALVAALSWQGGSWALAHLHLSSKLDSLSWILLASAALQAHLAGRARRLPAMAACVGLSFLAGFPQLAALGVAALALQALAAPLCEGRPWRRVALVVPMLLAGMALAAPWLLPLLEASAHSLRQAQAAAQLELGRLPPGALASLVVPDAFGAPQDGVWAPANATAWLATTSVALASSANGLEWNLHLGALLVAAACAALLRPSRRLVAPLLLASASLGFALQYPPFDWLAGLPGFSSGAPSRAGAYALVGLAWLGAHGIEGWLAGDRRAIVGGAVVLGILALACGGLALSLAPQRHAAELVEHWMALHEVGRATVEGTLPMEELARQLELLARHAWLGAALASAGLVALWLARLRPELGAACLALGALAGVPWLAAGRATAQESGPDGFLPSSPLVDATRAACGDGRLVRHDRGLSGVQDVERLLRPGLAQAVGIADLTPWIVFQPRTLVELWARADPASAWRSGIARATSLAALEGRIADELRITAVLARERLSSPRLSVAAEREGFVVHARSGSKPMASFVDGLRLHEGDAAVLAALESDEPGVHVPRRELARAGLAEPGAGESERELPWSRPAPDRLVVELDGLQAGFVVCREQWAPGWRARVDGVDAPVLRANHALRAVPVPAGARRVELRHVDEQSRIGLVVSIVAALALLAAWRAERSAP
jgi:hypothetical protein